MPTLKPFALSLLALTLLVGCGGRTTTSSAAPSKAAAPSGSAAAPTAPAAAAATPVASQSSAAPGPLIAVVEEGSPTSLRLITLQGREVAHTSLPSPGAVAGVGGDIATFVVGDELRALRRSGVVETLGRLPGYSAGPIVVSPDGRYWLWSVYSSSGAGVSSKLMLSRRGGPDRAVAQQTTTAEPRVLQPYRWGPAGPIYQSSAMGLGGYILFGEYTTGPTWRLDPDTGQTTQLLDGVSCPLADLDANGTIACFSRDDGGSLAVLSPDGHTVQMPLPRPAFTQRGAVSFKPGSGATGLVIGGATGAGADGGQEQFETDLVEVRDRTLRRFGPAGLRPGDGSWTWLPDGSLISYRPARARGGDPGVYVVAPDGTARKVFPSGVPVGVLTS